MRFQVLLKKENVPGTNFFPFFETDDIQEAKDFACAWPLRSSTW